MAIADVTIRGAGIFGLSIAFVMAQRGAKVQVIDPSGPGRGASGGFVGALAPHVPDQWNAKKAFQLDSLLIGQDFWQSVDQISGCASGYIRSGRVQVLGPEGRALAEQRAHDTQVNWRGQATWQVTTTPNGVEVFDSLSALIHPRQAVASLIEALRQMGASVGTEANERGPVVHATGWQGLFAQGWGGGVKGQAVLFGHDLRGAPQRFAEALHFVPHGDGTTAIGSTSERTWTSDDPDALCDDLIAKARALWPELGAAPVLERWAGIRPRAQSRAPILGKWPGKPGHFVANGGFKIGVGLAPKVAQVMADLVLDDRDEIPVDFAPAPATSPS